MIAIFVTVMLLIPTFISVLIGPDRLPEFWLAAFAFPLQVASIVFVLRVSSNARPYQLGLSPHRAADNACLGYLFWLGLTPLAYLIEFAVVVVYPDLYGHNPSEHPLFRALEKAPATLDWVVAFLVAIVFAPLLEELLFRGILQSWLTHRPGGHNGALLAALAVASIQNFNRFENAWVMPEGGERWAQLVEAISPTLFVLAMIPGCKLAEMASREWLHSTAAGSAIYSTALFFAAVHSFAWPTPIPLFVLGIGLSYLAYRTHSVLGCITLHALFNAVACLGDLISHLA